MSKFEFKSPGVKTRETDLSVIAPERPEMGPIIIGRTRKRPAGVPVSIDSLDNFNEIFGLPVPGMASDDVWRNGTTGPTYAAYAAQSWLASETTPVNIVRVLGEQASTNNGTTGKAGWSPAGSAYGLFIMNAADSSQAAGNNSATGSLAAVFYTNNADYAVTLSGSIVGEIGSATTTATATLIDIAGYGFGNSFKINVPTAAGGSGNDITIILEDTANGATNAGANKIAVGATGPAAGADVAEALVDAINGFFGTGGTYNHANMTAANTDASISGGIVGVTATVVNTQEIKLTADNPGLGGNLITVTDIGGGLATNGTLAGGNEVSSTGPGEVIQPAGDNYEYTAVVLSNKLAGTVEETITFNFNRQSESYIRNVFNTNPTLCNSTLQATAKNYWLGETFDRSMKSVVTKGTQNDHMAVILPLGQATGSLGWEDHKEAMRFASTGWFISQDFGANTDYRYDAAGVEKLFRLEALGGGEGDNTSFYVTIENIKLPSDPTTNNYGSFSVNIRTVGTGTLLESFSNLNFNPVSNDFILRRIGDQKQTWNSDLNKYEIDADTQYLNRSSYVRVVMYGGQENLPTRQNALPFGFLGPVQPKKMTLTEGTTLQSEWVQNMSASVFGTASQGSSVINYGDSSFSADLTFPSLALRISGSDGLNPQPAKAMWGIQPTIEQNSRSHDSGYCDYLRPISTVDVGRTALLAANDTQYQYSFAFSLDNVVSGTAGVGWIYSGSTDGATKDGSRVNNASYTYTNSVADLLKAGVNKFAAPMVGGFDGFDILEAEPLGNHKTSGTSTDYNSYVRYSLHKALGAVSDEEVVPANMLLIPGQQNPVITDQIVSTANDRQDLLAIIDLEDDYSPATEATTSDRGDVIQAISTFNNRTNINSSYGCAFYPAVQIADTNSGQYVWVPSSVAAVGAMAQSQKAAELWFAPAGFNRGGLGALGGPRGPVVIQARQKLDSSQRDDLYEVNINPIASFPNEGVVIFGQKTLQRSKSALDRINVRRLMIHLKKEISDIAKLALFEQNNSATRGSLSRQISAILSGVKSRFGLSDYKVVLDDTNNTADDVDNNRLNVAIYVKPTRAIEFIAIDFIITRSGVEFAE